MKHHIENLIYIALNQLQQLNELPAIPAFIQVDLAKEKQHGDFASNIALTLAKATQKKPREIAERIIQLLPASTYVEKVEIAGPGFINFFLSTDALSEIVRVILTEKDAFGRSKMGREKKVLVEFVSSNPTGPLHVGHGRHAIFGDVIANLLDAVGFKIYREYYLNDAGRQMDILTLSIWLRYLSLCDVNVTFPPNAYQGEYVSNIAKTVYDAQQNYFKVSAAELFDKLNLTDVEKNDPEIYIDKLIQQAKNLLQEKYDMLLMFGLANIVDDLREDLAEFGVHYDNWFSEREFIATKEIDKLLDQLKANNHVYEKDGAIWFRATDFGDTKDRVLVRANGQRTYFANDVAYHLSKFARGFDISIDIFGADHHGYVPRMKAAMQASGIDPERLIYLLVQFVSLYRGQEQISMSTRGGNFVTLRELRKEVGNDAARFFYLMRKCEQPIDFDLELAKKQSTENPVYYVQYAFARICSVFKQLDERDLNFDEINGLSNLNLLTQDHERHLLTSLARYQDVIINAALHYEPHLLTNYLRELATDFHAYYNSHQFIVDDQALRNARLALISAVQQTLFNGFNLLGIHALATM